MIFSTYESMVTEMIALRKGDTVWKTPIYGPPANTNSESFDWQFFDVEDQCN
jgi:hypothetical protein